MSEAPAPLYVIKGDDASLIAQRAHTTIHELLGSRDPSVAIEEHGLPGADELDIGVVIDAYTTPAFLVDRRIIVLRDAGRLSAQDATRLLEVLEVPMATSVLVLVAGGGTIPQSIAKFAKANGVVVETAAGTGKARTSWIAEHLKGGSVRLDAKAQDTLSKHLGEDLGRLEGILATLAAAYGEGATISEAELVPFLGERGSVPPWDLTDAIDRGQTEGAIEVLHRMADAGGRSAPEIVALLHRHYRQMLRLDGVAARTGEEAAAVLGISSAFPAKKALDQARSLGSTKIGDAICLVATADVETKGMTGLDGVMVLEVLVGRLSRLGGRSGTRPQRR